MESHELLRDIFEKSNVKQIAAALGLSLSLVYKWAEPAESSGTGSGAANPLAGLYKFSDRILTGFLFAIGFFHRSSNFSLGFTGVSSRS